MNRRGRDGSLDRQWHRCAQTLTAHRRTQPAGSREGEGRKSCLPWATVPTLEVREAPEPRPSIPTSTPGCGAAGKMLSVLETLFPLWEETALSPSPFLKMGVQTYWVS